jgi:hypothetical protein
LSCIAFPWASGVGMEMRTVRYMGLDEDAGDSIKGADGGKPGATERRVPRGGERSRGCFEAGC